MPGLKDLIKRQLKVFNLAVTRHDSLTQLREKAALEERLQHGIHLITSLPQDRTQELMRALPHTRSQLGQDLFVLAQLNFKMGGYFVEFGATNGVDLSNTCLLERNFGWKGILAEPGRCWQQALAKNRTARIDTRCVWKESEAALVFNEADDAELSTLSHCSNGDLQGKTYEVKTISLNHLLAEHGAPEEIDYLSIDTEGSEFDILSNFDFSKHSFRVITCEHNFTPMRQKIFELLSDNGLVRVHQELSEFDDWYVRRTH